MHDPLSESRPTAQELSDWSKASDVIAYVHRSERRRSTRIRLVSLAAVIVAVGVALVLNSGSGHQDPPSVAGTTSVVARATGENGVLLLSAEESFVEQFRRFVSSRPCPSPAELIVEIDRLKYATGAAQVQIIDLTDGGEACIHATATAETWTADASVNVTFLKSKQ